MIPCSGPGDPFPPVERALDTPNGLLAVGGGLGVARLLDAYARGIFPWFSEGDPVLWWCPDPRMVLPTDAVHVSRSLRRRLRRRDYQVTLDQAFAQVVTACAAPRRDEAGTWLVPSMIRAYLRLHDAGAAHSIEVWIDGSLAGGVYGVAIGRMFFGESMFSLAAERIEDCPGRPCRATGALEIPADRLSDANHAPGDNGSPSHHARQICRGRQSARPASRGGLAVAAGRRPHCDAALSRATIARNRGCARSGSRAGSRLRNASIPTG